MLIQAITVFLALIGTTLACINTGARVTYAMGRDEELAGNLGVLHPKNLTPYRVDLDVSHYLDHHWYIRGNLLLLRWSAANHRRNQRTSEEFLVQFRYLAS